MCAQDPGDFRAAPHHTPSIQDVQLVAASSRALSDARGRALTVLDTVAVADLQLL